MSQGARPLQGRRIVVTRAREQALPLRELLEAAGAEVLEVPVIRIEPPASWEPLDRALARLDGYAWVVFTSVNGVESVRKRAALAGEDRVLGSLARLRVAAIGPATAAALGAWGMRPEVVPEEYRAEGLVERLRGLVRAGDLVLLPRAAEAREVLLKELERLGARVEEVAAYRTVPAPEAAGLVREALAGGAVDAVTFTSPSTVHHFMALLDVGERAALFAGARAAAIGPVTAEALAGYGVQPAVLAAEYTIAGLARALIRYYETSPERG
jgi:uroporphyrinogen III methyltransferase/synthase